jgi:hypothetical protein
VQRRDGARRVGPVVCRHRAPAFPLAYLRLVKLPRMNGERMEASFGGRER